MDIITIFSVLVLVCADLVACTMTGARIFNITKVFERAPDNWSNQQICWLYLHSVHDGSDGIGGRTVIAEGFGEGYIPVLRLAQHANSTDNGAFERYHLNITNYTGHSVFDKDTDYCTTVGNVLANVGYNSGGVWRQTGYYKKNRTTSANEKRADNIHTSDARDVQRRDGEMGCIMDKCQIVNDCIIDHGSQCSRCEKDTYEWDTNYCAWVDDEWNNGVLQTCQLMIDAALYCVNKS